MPRWPVSTAFSSSSAASVATASGSLLAVDANVGLRSSLGHGGLRHSAAARTWRKPLDAERPDRWFELTLEHEPRDGVGGDRREQNSVAMVAGGVDEPCERSRAEDRRIVAAAGTMADPHFIDRQFLDRRHRPPGRFQQRQQAARGQRGVEAFFLDRRAHDQAAIPARHQIDARRPDHVR